MARQEQIKNCRPRCLVNLQNVGKCKRLLELVPVRLVVQQVVSESLHSCIIAPLGLPVCLRVIDYGEVVFRTQYYAYGVEEFGDKLLLVVG